MMPPPKPLGGAGVHLYKSMFLLAFLTACDDGGGSAAQQGDAADATPAVDATRSDGGAMSDAVLPDAATADAARPDDAASGADAGPPEGPPCEGAPLVMAHGLLASGDTWAPHVKRFEANGHPVECYHAFDWQTLNMGADHPGRLDAFIDAVRAYHGAEQVDLMGHSAGGGLGYEYLADPNRVHKVRKYVHVGSIANEAPAGPVGMPVDMLNVWSEGDLIVDGADIPGAQNAQIPAQDHYSVATSAPAFAAVYRFLYGRDAGVLDAPAEASARVAGKAVILADNTPEAGGTVAIWPVSAETGQRIGDTPAATFTVAEDGSWGPFDAALDQHYEFHLQPARPVTPVRYYREPFNRSDPLVYLRSLPTAGVAGALLRQLTPSDAHTILVVFNASGATITGRDSLTLDGEELATPELCAAEDTTIALFVYDQGVDGMPGGPIAAFAGLPFLAGLDRFLPADPMAFSTVVLNGRTLHLPRWPSATEGAVIASFD